MQFRPFTLRNKTIDPPLFCAPMAGNTHSAFRRLCADFGGYGALFTEMLPGGRLKNEAMGSTPFTKRRPQEGLVWYQLVVNSVNQIPAAIGRMKEYGCEAVDLNAACPAPPIVQHGAGGALFRDTPRLVSILTTLRSNWDGPLTVKIRLGHTEQNWQAEFIERIRLIEECGVDALFVHPRFGNERLKRRARWELFPWITSVTRLPVIANGDVIEVHDVTSRPALFGTVRGLMLGRAALVKPWIFNEFSHGLGLASGYPAPEKINYSQVWHTLAGYIEEDFEPCKALGRIKEFTRYFAGNFFYGHVLRAAMSAAHTMTDARHVIDTFFKDEPRIALRPSVWAL